MIKFFSLWPLWLYVSAISVQILSFYYVLAYNPQILSDVWHNFVLMREQVSQFFTSVQEIIQNIILQIRR